MYNAMPPCRTNGKSDAVNNGGTGAAKKDDMKTNESMIKKQRPAGRDAASTIITRSALGFCAFKHDCTGIIIVEKQLE